MPSLEDLGEALVGDQLRRMELRIMNRLDQISLQVTQNGVDQEALEQALAALKAADITIDSIEPEDAP